MFNKIGRQTPTNSYVIPYKSTLGYETVEVYNNTTRMYVDKHYVYGSDIYFLRDQRAIIEATLAKESRIVYYKNILREYSDIGADKIKKTKIQGTLATSYLNNRRIRCTKRVLCY